MLVPYPISNKSALNFGIDSSVGKELKKGKDNISNRKLDIGQKIFGCSFLFSGLF